MPEATKVPRPAGLSKSTGEEKWRPWEWRVMVIDSWLMMVNDDY